METRLPLQSLLFFGVGLLSAGEWTNVEGKTIVADFVRVDESEVVLRSRGQTYRVQMENLSPQSQQFALYCQNEINRWALEVAESPILSERTLLELLTFAPNAVEGRHYLVEGNVEELRVGTALTPTPETPTVVLGYGTICNLNLRNHVSRTSKLKLDDDRITLFKLKGVRDFAPEKTLLEVGQAIVIRATVKSGRIIGQGEAPTAEVTAARAAVALSKGQLEFGEAQQMQIRIRYLESMLEGNAGTASISGTRGYIGTVTFQFSVAEKAAMREELELLKAQLSAMAQ